MKNAENKPFYITNAIDYVNAKPHVGHAVEKVLTDVIARYHREVLENADTYFLTGTDENAMKNVQAAQQAGQSAATFVEENSQAFKDLGKQLNLSFDQFIRTTEKRHFAGAQKLWSLFRPEDIYKKKYHGLYCVGCEEFKMEKDLVDGRCPEHLKAPEKVEEENYFFKLSNYAKKLEELIVGDTIKIVPTYRKNEMLSFIKMGLEDFSISRSVERAKHWGVPVPDDATQVMYVWVDALSNYISALDFATDGDLYKKYWAGEGERTHVIGKGILRFHAIYWPAMLLSAQLPLPTTIYAHEYLTINGQKMSKTLGNVLYPSDLVEKFGADGTRYLLITALPYSKDGDLSWEKMTEKYNADLANGLGNLLSRVIKLASNLKPITNNPKLEDKEFSEDLKKLIEEFRFADALSWIWNLVREANQYIDEMKPWELVKTDQQQFEKVLQKLLADIKVIAGALAPFMPETAEKIKKALRERKTVPLFERIR